jgi:ferredoxin-nitrite reductase
MQLDYPVNLHFSGCDKSCAQHHPSDIAIVGKDFATYTIYLGDGEIDFGRELYGDYRADDLPMLVEQLLTIYQNQRQPKQSFREFVNHCDLQELANKLREVIRYA